jgi:protein-S-isoprenylcysteine O-methyltransferase Ste14
LLRRLNDLPIFDPGRWPAREVVSRIIGSVAVSTFILRRILQLPSWPGYIAEVRWAQAWFAKLSFLPKVMITAPFDLEADYAPLGFTHDQVRTLWILSFLVWLAETGILLGYLLALLTRERAQSVAKGFMQTLFPLLLAGLPFAVVMTNYTFHQWFQQRPRQLMVGLYAVNAILFAGAALNATGVLTLRRGYTIMSEARVFIRRGIYRWIRHPMYASHFVIYLGYTLLHFHAATVVLYFAFVAGQTLRARIEEGKMTAVFPEYAEYKRTTGMFFPRIIGVETRITNHESRVRPPSPPGGDGGIPSGRDS